MKTERREVYYAIDSERAYQDSVWPNGIVHAQEQSIGEAILLVEEYATRARKAWSGQPYPETEALEMIRKIAGITVRCMETHGAPHREGF